MALSDAELVRLCAEKVTQAVIAEWNPLNNDTDCMAVLDKMAADGWLCNIYGDGEGWACDMYHGTPKPAEGDDGWLNGGPEARRRAIVVAALRAVGVEV